MSQEFNFQELMAMHKEALKIAQHQVTVIDKVVETHETANKEAWGSFNKILASQDFALQILSKSINLLEKQQPSQEAAAPAPPAPPETPPPPATSLPAAAAAPTPPPP